MPSRTPFSSMAAGFTLALLFAAPSAIQSQTSNPAFSSIPAISFNTDGPVIRAHTESEKPFTVAGERGVLVGQQNGAFEAWLLPVKLLSHLTIEANVEGYTVPIDVNRQASQIEVRPDRTILTYAHIGFTVRQIMFSPAQTISAAPAQTGPVVLFEFDCPHPTDFVFRFTPELRWMWPERNEGVPGIEWVPGVDDGKVLPGGMNGFYILHSDYPDFAGAVTIPGAQPGILAPFQERPQIHPVELKLHIDPARDRGRLFPLLMAVGASASTATNASLATSLAQLNAAIPALYKTHAETYKALLANSVAIETPDKALNEAFQWAVISIEQLKTKVKDTGFSPYINQPNKDGAPRAAGKLDWLKGTGFSPYINESKETRALAPEETALVAGYYASGDSARPGFGWFFGRDALYTLFAVNGYGDFKLSKSELEFLIRRQRDDGKIMHEYSQTAAFIDWKSFPYMYAAADATPLFLLAVADYVRSSGDATFLTAHRDSIEKAWAFETDPAHDTDHDGIYDNSQGTGWVESWPGAMPHQEIYLALLDQQASQAYADLESILGNKEKSSAATARAGDIQSKIEKEYYDPQKGCYAFATNPPGTPNSPVDRTTTVYPALAWWSTLPSGKATIAQPDGCLKQFASNTLNTDWGLRDVANDEKIYDGMSYHQGSVWPLFTGWASLAEYRGGQPLAGYQMLMENANLTRAQDLGAVTELLSGDFNVPFGRSTSHQLWSSAMVITPTLRGLFGIDIDAQTKTITVNPHLPASWTQATIRHIAVGNETVDLLFTQILGAVTIRIQAENAGRIKLATSVPDARQFAGEHLEIPGPGVEVELGVSAPLPGARNESARVLSQTVSDNLLTLILEGPAGSDFSIPLFVNLHLQKLGISGAVEQSNVKSERRNTIVPPTVLTGHFPPGEGWKTITVTLTW